LKEDERVKTVSKYPDLLVSWALSELAEPHKVAGLQLYVDSERYESD